jgi:hypothetical protein
VAPSSPIEYVITSQEHDDGGANCFISNDITHFTSYLAKPLLFKQLNHSSVKALGYGLNLIQCPSTKTIIPLWSTYYMPSNPQCTFSLTALSHYLQYKIITEHLNSLTIITSSGTTLRFPSIKQISNNQLLNYHEFIVIKPTSAHCLSLPTPIAQSATSESPWNHLLVHQCLGHNSDEVLDTIVSSTISPWSAETSFPTL